MLALAQHRKAPVQTYESKESPWAPRTVVYAHYDDSILAGAHPHFKAYKDSKKYHSRVGMVTDAATAETTGALTLDAEAAVLRVPKLPPADLRFRQLPGEGYRRKHDAQGNEARGRCGPGDHTDASAR